MLDEEGEAARVPELTKFSKKHGLKMGTIGDMIEYRRKQERLIEQVEVVDMPTDYGVFQLHMFVSTLNPAEHHLALVRGKIDPEKPVLVRVHSECLTGDVFGSRRCDCGSQLHSALERIDAEGIGVLVYMRQEGRGIGLVNKMHAYKLQEGGLDTVEANEKLGFPSDLRDYGMGAQILTDLGVRQIRLMTNNPRKVIGLDGHELEIVEQVPIKFDATPENEAYLNTKREKMGHRL